MRKPILTTLCLALAACSYNLDGSSSASSAPAAARQEVEWRFKDGTTPGPNDKVEPPGVVSQARAEYAIEARKQRLQGDVGLEMEVDENGDVVNVVVTQPLEPSLDANAVTAARKWKYMSARLNGTAKAIIVKAVVKYRVG
jgi:TonB family protein